LVLFCWLGPAIGFAVAGIATASAGELVTWPVWVIGGIVGGLFPLSAVFFGIAGLKEEDSKGISVAGMVLGAVAALLGLGISAGIVALGSLGEKMVEEVRDNGMLDQMGNRDTDFQEMMRQMNDPDFQRRLQEQLQAPAAPPSPSAEYDSLSQPSE
jgi:Na+/citrate or Na+/malate symporter